MAYTIPKPAAPQGGNLPFLGPYAQNQAQAELAYQRAQSALAARRGTLLQQYGYTPTANGGMAVDPNNPYGALQQMQLANQQEAHAGELNTLSRGFNLGPGLGAQNESRAQFDAGGRSFALAQAFAGANETQQEASMAAQDALDQATLSNQLGTTDYAIQHGIFTPAAVRLSDPEVQARVHAMKMAFNQAFKRPKGGTRTNAKGLTFQQVLAKIGADNLYNPTSTFKVGGQKF